MYTCMIFVYLCVCVLSVCTHVCMLTYMYVHLYVYTVYNILGVFRYMPRLDKHCPLFSKWISQFGGLISVMLRLWR